MTKPLDPKELPTADEVRALLDYDPETGVLTWRPRQGDDRATRSWNARFAAKRAGSQTNGYWRLSLFDQGYLAHRVAWVWMTGSWPEGGLDIDHADGDPGNNRFSNLRLATDSENLANAKRCSTNSTNYKGVYFVKSRRRYGAQITVRGRGHYLGLFDTPEEAHAAYMAAARRHFGQFARAA